MLAFTADRRSRPEGDDYVRHPLIGGGLNEGFFSCGVHAQTRSWHHRGLRGSAHFDQIGRLVIGEIHSSHARMAELRP
jgi:hypothetical protein